MLETRLQMPSLVKLLVAKNKPLTFSFAPPFNQEIMEAPRPKKVKIPSLDLYDGTTDPK